MFTHFKDGRPAMVDVSDKEETVREATAQAVVLLPVAVASAWDERGTGKGDPIAVAELAGVMAAKRTAELIPLCHPLPLSNVIVHGEFVRESSRVVFTANCKTTARTGVEMEALTAASIAALTLYDMLKSGGKDMTIEQVKLLAKTGGKSGPWQG